ncbi:MAG: IS66 family insertion sequence element accessory protein TnpB [Prevotella sp.]|nr:IS66 family insertion sequence element accessory protein TnpB [Prevotella sp.]
MLAITGATNLFYVSGFTDMRCGKYTLANVVKNIFHRNPYNGDGYVFRSKNGRTVKILVYQMSLYRLYDLSYDDEYRFMNIEKDDGSPLDPVSSLEWKYLVALINCPVRRRILI